MEKILSLKIRTSPEDLERIRTARAVIEEACSLINEAEGITNDDNMPAYSVQAHEDYVTACCEVLDLLNKIETGEVI